MDTIAKIDMYIEHCCNCGMAFAMTREFQRRKINDKKSFYCPKGHSQYYVGQTEEQKLKKQLDHERQLRHNAESKQFRAQDREKITRALHDHTKARVNKGLCPCCDRSFGDLRRHMKSKHKDYLSAPVKLREFRQNQGLTQNEIEKLIGLPNGYLCQFENEHHVPEWAELEIKNWVDENL